MIPSPTDYAKKLKDYLQKFGARVSEEVWDGHKHVDLSIDTGKLDIEVDGLQHLTDPDQILTDFERSKYSREDGYETIRVHNIDLEHDVEDIAKAIADVATKREDDLIVMAGEEESTEQ
jgi:very-short-patch-repair endonuclease